MEHAEWDELAGLARTGQFDSPRLEELYQKTKGVEEHPDTYEELCQCDLCLSYMDE